MRGCEHPEKDAKFCPECGVSMWVVDETSDEKYENAVEDFREAWVENSAAEGKSPVVINGFSHPLVGLRFYAGRRCVLRKF